MSDDAWLVGGRYELAERLGHGGMAEVRRGVDQRLKRPVAVKLLSRTLTQDPELRKRFRREAEATARLNHPSIAAVYDSGEDVDPATGVATPYMVMELVEGRTLRDVLNERHSLPPVEALELSRGVLEALAHSHAAGIVHRDIKPANVMLTPTRGIKVMDFGIARAATDTSEGLTKTATVIGTAAYLSPEQARGESVDLRSDLYSTGCLLYELLVAKPPFVGESSVSVAYQHVREPAVAPSAVDPAISADVDAVVLKALAKDPADRYPSADAMVADLDRLLAHQPVEAAIATDPRTVAAVPRATAPLPAPVAAMESVPTVVVPPTSPLQTSPPPRRTGRVVLVAVLAVALLLAGFGVYRQLAGPGAEATLVEVPPVLGQTRAEAEATLRAAGFEPASESVPGKSGKTVGTVLEQRPLGGTELVRGGTVTLQINAGPESATIPDGLVGQDVDTAADALDKAGFSNVKRVRSSDVPTSADQGDVLSVNPGQGETAGLDELVELTYAAVDGAPTSASSAAPTESRTSEPADQPSSSDSAGSDPSVPPPASSRPTSSKPTSSATQKPSTPSSSASAKRADKTKNPKASKSPNPNKPAAATGSNGNPDRP